MNFVTKLEFIHVQSFDIFRSSYLKNEWI